MIKNYSLKILNQSQFPLPEYQTIGSSGVDLRANLEAKMIIMPHKVYQIPTGIFLEMPIGIEAQIRARSGLALKHGLSLVNGVGTIDADYRGEIKIILINLLDKPYQLEPGERIAQMVFSEYVKADFIEVFSTEALAASERGDGGFGHSGK
ncbi:dUTP diphosphatase [Acetobacterium sp.]|jgi:dUTP pyrophosphatase|uniref:dUTP diphosphatase n=1 Tax=Acetobacterium sp. TaxID=1872094 RepID=UPI000CA778C6|nr:dUTP diphosphatase [Acetobacterium sp.]MDO9491356.1 dUTP diphosphatase [Acetobacterium sp.]PKM71224.1 MAG: dUTP diphosphatase [Firmicutes bacterium HGW-Firmicutes-17]